MTDLLIIETNSGGDLLLRGNDLVGVTGVENTPYLGMFGGSAWWGNFLVPNNPWQSQTETALNKNTINSAGRSNVEDAVNADLQYLNNISGTTWGVATSIESPNRIRIAVTINGQEFIYLWEPDKLFLTYQV